MPLPDKSTISVHRIWVTFSWHSYSAYMRRTNLFWGADMGEFSVLHVEVKIVVERFWDFCGRDDTVSETGMHFLGHGVLSG